MPPVTTPLITIDEFAKRLQSTAPFVLLDVRESWELDAARLVDSRLAVRPMSQLAREGLDALPPAARSKDALIYVLCHQGVRSAQVAAWLSSAGWTAVFSVAGGIDEYARKIDHSVGMY